MLYLLTLFLGLFLLVKGANMTIDGASKLAKHLGVSELFIGLSIVSVGTSLPELVVSVRAAILNSGVSISNIMGSNIANLALALGMAATVHPIHLENSSFKYELPFCTLLSIVFGIMVLWHTPPMLARWEGYILLLFLAAFLWYLYKMGTKKTVHLETENEHKVWKLVMITALGLAGVMIGGDMAVKSAVKFAKAARITETLIGVSAIAIGTSLPEIVTAVTAMLKKRSSLAFGNIIGSNVINIALIMGLSATIRPIGLDVEKPVVDVLYMISLPVFLLLTMGERKTISKGMGILLLASYTFYMTYVFFRG